MISNNVDTVILKQPSMTIILIKLRVLWSHTQTVIAGDILIQCMILSATNLIIPKYLW